MSMLGRNHLIKDSLMASLAAPIRTESSINSSCDNQILSFGRLAGEKNGVGCYCGFTAFPKQKSTQIDAVN